MSRRVSLPGADELFRATGPGPVADRPLAATTTDPASRPSSTGGGEGAEQGGRQPADAIRSVDPGAGQADPGLLDESSDDTSGDAGRAVPSRATGTLRRPATRRRPHPVGDRLPTGRERHEEKITVYVSADELVGLEQARITLRAEHGLAVDRGRIVREALAVVLADLDAKGEASTLVRRLGGR